MARQSIAPGYLQTVAAGRLRAREAKLERDARAKLQREVDERTLQRQLATGIVSALVQGGVNIGAGALKDMWDRAAQERALGAKAAMEQGVVTGPGGEALTAAARRRSGKPLDAQAPVVPTPQRPTTESTPAAPTQAASVPLIRSRRPEGRTARRQIESTAAPVPTTARTSGVPRGRPDEGGVPRGAVETRRSRVPDTRRARQAITALPGQPTQQQPPPQASEPPATRRPASIAAEVRAKKAAAALRDLFPRREREPGYRADITTPEQLAESVAQKASSIIAALPEEQRQRAQTDYDLATGRQREMRSEQQIRELEAEYKRSLIGRGQAQQRHTAESYANELRTWVNLNSPVNTSSYGRNMAGSGLLRRRVMPVTSQDLLTERFDVASSLAQGRLIKSATGERLIDSPRLRQAWVASLPNDQRQVYERGGIFRTERPMTESEYNLARRARRAYLSSLRTRIGAGSGQGTQSDSGTTSLLDALGFSSFRIEGVRGPRDPNQRRVAGTSAANRGGEMFIDPYDSGNLRYIYRYRGALAQQANMTEEEQKLFSDSMPYLRKLGRALAGEGSISEEDALNAKQGLDVLRDAMGRRMRGGGTVPAQQQEANELRGLVTQNFLEAIQEPTPAEISPPGQTPADGATRRTPATPAQADEAAKAALTNLRTVADGFTTAGAKGVVESARSRVMTDSGANVTSEKFLIGGGAVGRATPVDAFISAAQSLVTAVPETVEYQRALGSLNELLTQRANLSAPQRQFIIDELEEAASEHLIQKARPYLEELARNNAVSNRNDYEVLKRNNPMVYAREGVAEVYTNEVDRARQSSAPGFDYRIGDRRIQVTSERRNQLLQFLGSVNGFLNYSPFMEPIGGFPGPNQIEDVPPEDRELFNDWAEGKAGVEPLSSDEEEVLEHMRKQLRRYFVERYDEFRKAYNEDKLKYELQRQNVPGLPEFMSQEFFKIPRTGVGWLDLSSNVSPETPGEEQLSRINRQTAVRQDQLNKRRRARESMTVRGLS